MLSECKPVRRSHGWSAFAAALRIRQGATLIRLLWEGFRRNGRPIHKIALLSHFGSLRLAGVPSVHRRSSASTDAVSEPSERAEKTLQAPAIKNPPATIGCGSPLHDST